MEMFDGDSRYVRFIPWGTTCSTHCVGGRKVHREGLGAMTKNKSVATAENRNPMFQAVV